MTTIEQALHIFRKDVRHLRLEIAAILLLLVVLVITGVETWDTLQERGGPSYYGESPMDILLPLVWTLLIARAVQTEALPGDRHFWLTRPYSRTGLLLSKGMFIVAFVNLPFLLAQAAIVSFDGLPLWANLGGLLWNQVWVSVLLLLPVAAVASLTRNLAHFVPALVLAAAMILFAAGAHRSLGDMEWMRSLLGLGLLTSLAAFALWRQYRLRRAGNTALWTIGATIAATILHLSFPASAAFAIQSRLIGSVDQSFALRLAQPEPRPPDTTTPNRYQQLLELPLAVEGAMLQDVRVESSQMTIRTLSGIARRPRARVEARTQRLVNTVGVDRNFFEAAKNSPVNVSAEYYLTLFSTTNSVEVPMDGTPVYIPGPGQCGVVAGYEDREFVCRSAFRSPRPFLSDRVAGERNDDVYSPFPAEPRLYPVFARRYSLMGNGPEALAPPEPERPAMVMVREPSAYFRYTMQAPNVRLADFAITRRTDDDER